MLLNTAESRTDEQNISIEAAFAAELFSKLSVTAQAEIIDLLKSLLSVE